MTKKNLTNKLTKILGTAAIAASTLLPMKSYAQSGVDQFDKNTTFTTAGVNGTMDTLQLVHLHGRDYFVGNAENKLGFELYDANLVNVLNTFQGANGTTTTQIEPLVTYTPEQIQTDEGLADAIQLYQTGTFAKKGNTMAKELGKSNGNEQGHTKDIAGADFTGKYFTANISGNEYFYPLWTEADTANAGHTLEMAVMPVNGAQEAINYKGEVSLRNADNVWQFVYDSNKSTLKDTAEVRFASITGYPIGVEFKGPTTGQAKEFHNIEGLTTTPVEVKEEKKKSNSSFPPFRASAGLEGYLGGTANKTGGASLNASFQVQPTQGLWTGAELTYTPKMFSSEVVKTAEGQETFAIGSNRTLQSDTSTTTTTNTQVPVFVGAKVNYEVSENGELGLSIGAAKVNNTTSITGRRTNTQFLGDQQDGESETISTTEGNPIVLTNNGWALSAGVEYQHKINELFSVGGKLNLTGLGNGKVNLSPTIGVKYTFKN